MCMSEGCGRHLLLEFFVECSLEEFFQTLDDSNFFSNFTSFKNHGPFLKSRESQTNNESCIFSFECELADHLLCFGVFFSVFLFYISVLVVLVVVWLSFCLLLFTLI